MRAHACAAARNRGAPPVGLRGHIIIAAPAAAPLPLRLRRHPVCSVQEDVVAVEHLRITTQ